MATSIIHRAEQTGRSDEWINKDAVTPAHAGRKSQTLQWFPSGELGKVDVELETQLLNEGAAVLQPARDDAGKCAAPMSGKFEAPVLERRADAKEVARGPFSLPPTSRDWVSARSRQDENVRKTKVKRKSLVMEVVRFVVKRQVCG
jgi:hypothetical protein